MLWKPAMALRRVVLPHPEGPTTTQNSPGAMSMVQRSTAKDLGAVGIVYLADVVDLDVPAHGRFVAAHRASSLTFHCMRRLPIIRMSKLLNEPITPSVIMAMMITGYCTSMNEFQMR